MSTVIESAPILPIVPTTPLAGAPAVPAIHFRGVSKRFQLDKQTEHSLIELAARLVGRRAPREYFWPLQDVSFTIPRGVTVGLIGENGAGKSTLLKLVTRILQPTNGALEINGRVSALLELGAGFHPELTGRDNIHLHCALLGLRPEEIRPIVEPIVRFADLGAFIDTPVKHFSSGMYARLGFAISVYVKPEILLVDEVLAVGDEAFQRRCLDTIDQMRAGGVTIMIVSHSLSHVLTLCDQCIWLEDGRVRAHGPAAEVVRNYLSAVDKATAQRLINENALQDWIDEDPVEGAPGSARPPRRSGKGPVRITHVEMRSADGVATWSFDPLAPVIIRIEYTALEAVPEPVFSVLIHKQDGHYLWASNTEDHPVPPIVAAGTGVLEVDVTGIALAAGRYRLSAAAYPEPDPPYWSHPSDFHEQLYEFQVTSTREIHGDVVMPSRWAHQPPVGAPTPQSPPVGAPTPQSPPVGAPTPHGPPVGAPTPQSER